MKSIRYAVGIWSFRSMYIADGPQWELSPLPKALVDKYGGLRRSVDAMLVKFIDVAASTPLPPAPDVAWLTPLTG